MMQFDGMCKAKISIYIYPKVYNYPAKVFKCHFANAEEILINQNELYNFKYLDGGGVCCKDRLKEFIISYKEFFNIFTIKQLYIREAE